MSVLIKGMEMPKNCIMCPMSHEGDAANEREFIRCLATMQIIPEGVTDKPDWCPLVEVSERGEDNNYDR